MSSTMRYAAALMMATCLIGLSCAPAPEPVSDKKDAPKTSDTPAKIPGPLQKRIDYVLDNVRNRDLLTTHAFWTIFHGILGLGPDIQLLDPEKNEHVRAIDLVARGGPIRGLEFVETPTGIDVVTMAGSGVGQGHQDQFVAEMAQWNLPLKTPFKINGKDYTFEDFVRHSKARTSTTRNQELGWAVVIVAQYYGTDHKWKNQFGEDLTLEDVVRYEMNLPIAPAACGGTHRLFGLSWAYHLHLKNGGKTEGVWKELAVKLDEHKEAAKKFQNKDGSFSTEYVSGPGFSRDVTRRIASTRHVFEWLALALPDAELKEEWMENAAYALTMMILDNQTYALDGGALYHATHGLYMYRQRVYGTPGPPGLLIPRP